MGENKLIICEVCRKHVEVHHKERETTDTLNGITFSFWEKYSTCKTCGSEVYIGSEHDANLYQYQKAYNIAEHHTLYMGFEMKKEYMELVRKIADSHCASCYCGDTACEGCQLSPGLTPTKLASSDGVCIARYEMIKAMFTKKEQERR